MEGGVVVISINYRDARPIYEQVKDGFKQLIITGVLPGDTRMPSVRELASELTINPNTIQRAYRELELEGFIISVPGKGSFVSDGGDMARAHIEELREKLASTAEELRSFGMSDEEMIKIICGGRKHD